MPRTRSLPRDGFTLLEIMIVLVMIAILSGLAIPRLNMSRFRADTAMRTMQTVLQQAERAAVQRQTNVIVSFDLDGNRVRVHCDTDNDGVISPGEDARWRSLEEGNRFDVPPKGVTNTTVASAVSGNNIGKSPEGYPMVIYRRDGASSSAVEVYLRSSTSEINDFRALTVTQATGRVEIYRYGAGVWRKGQ